MTTSPANSGVRMIPGTSPESMGWPGPDYSLNVDGPMQIERNVSVPMRDGLRLLVDLYRPIGVKTDLPVLVAWSPYGKHGALDYKYWPGHDVDVSTLSKYAAFECPDPAFWTSHGYAVVLADARGSWGSEGNVTMCSPEEAEACCDLIEWLGARDWSNGRVGLSGVSWYSVIQWAVAARKPTHLSAINPWEGWSNLYHEVVRHGGIPETQFTTGLGPLIAITKGEAEDIAANAIEHPHYDEYWQLKTPDLTSIEVPAYVVASWSDHGLHTRGTLEAFRNISSTKKWLEVHGRKKWAHFYDPESVSRQLAFFDFALKGERNETETWPPVRLEIRDRACEGVVRAEKEWPLSRTQYVQFQLDAERRTLGTSAPDRETAVRYDAVSGSVHFDHVFAKDTEITGYSALRLWVEADGSDDMDLFVGLQKIDQSGSKVNFPFFSTFDDGNVALGWLRVSRRELDRASTPEQPRYTQQRDQYLQPGQIVPVDIEIWPSGTFFRAGETLRLVVQGHDINNYRDDLFAQAHRDLANAGTHIVHAGGKYDSHLLIPVIPAGDGGDPSGDNR